MNVVILRSLKLIPDSSLKCLAELLKTKKKSKKKIYLKMGFAVWTEGKHANAVKV